MVRAPTGCSGIIVETGICLARPYMVGGHELEEDGKELQAESSGCSDGSDLSG